ncbi:MAG: tRNA lysidine(34) synthetase TilS [Lentisphaeria bacterium]|nr:tRNA lysidine(34) synthetase TilS [Lentisphaeria bacterium]
MIDLNLFENAMERLPAHIDHIYVGFSGGVDSCALLMLLKKCWLKNLTAIHINHHLREESNDDQVFCEHFTQQLQVPILVEQIFVNDEMETGESIEMAARRLRLNCFHKINKPNAYFALGHHADDVLENFLLRFLRGSNSSGLSGLREYHKINEIHLWRPLLQFRKEDLKQWLSDAGFSDFCKDHSNLDITFKRNHIRLNVIPELEKVFGQLNGAFHSMNFLNTEASFLDEQVQQLDLSSLTCETLLGISPALWDRVIKRFFFLQTGNRQGVRLSLIDTLKNYVNDGQINFKIDFHKDFFLTVRNGNFLVIKKQDKKTSDFNYYWNLVQDNSIELPELNLRFFLERVHQKQIDYKDLNHFYFSCKNLPSHVRLRSRRPGDRMIVFGDSQERKLKHLLQSYGNKENRTPEVVVEMDEQITWVFPFRRSNHFPVDVQEVEVWCIKAIEV